MPKARLGKRTVDAIVPGERPFVVYDEALTGFGVRVMPSGTKTWVVEYRPHGGGRAVPTKSLSR